MTHRIPSSRGQSEVLSVIFLVTLIVLALGLIIATGFGALGTTRSNYGHSVAENQLTEFSSSTTDIAFSSTKRSSIDLELSPGQTDGHTTIQETEGQIHVQTGGSTLYTGPLGSIVYQPDSPDAANASVGFQGGAVWQRTPDGVAIIDAPPMSEKNLSTRSLTLPLFRVKGDGEVISGATVTQREMIDAYPGKSVAKSETVTVTLTSRYYRGWGRYFNESLDVDESDITYNHANEQVTITIGDNEELFLHLRVYVFNVSPN
jgi:hypothetical protein